MSNEELQLFGYISKSYQDPSLTKYMSLTESEKVQVGKSLIDQIYVNIADKYNVIDFGTIPKSAGKLSSMAEFNNLSKSIALLERIAIDTNQDISEIKTLSLALANIMKMEDTFHMGFVKKNPQLIMTYNLLAMSIYCGTSLMISVLVDYVNLSNSDEVQVIVTKKYSKNNSYLMINSLNSFNEMVRNGSFGTFVTDAMKPAPLKEVGIFSISVAILAVIGLFKVIPTIKELIYIFYYSRMKISDAASVQAELIQANIESIKHSGTATPKMIKIQSWFVDKLQKITQLFAIKYEKSEKEAAREADRKITPDEVTLF